MKARSREFLFAAALLVLLGISYWFGFRTIELRRLAAEAAVSENTALIDRLNVRLASGNIFSSQLDRLAEAAKFFGERLPAENEIDGVLDRLTRIAESNGLQSQSFKSQRVSRGAAYGEQQLQLTLVGSFPSFYQFLVDFERSPRISRVTRMGLRRDVDGTLRADLTVSVFFSPTAPLSSVFLSEAR